MSSDRSNDDLAVHFFTIVLNGEPFIRYHIEAFKNLPFPWHWHIVEGVAKLVQDTAWSVASGGKVTDSIQAKGRSKDGTSEYLDRLAAEYPENITIYRKPAGSYWEGKLEMVSAPLANLPEHCLLWQIDVDELWSQAQIITMRELFLSHSEKSAAWFWCHYFVGPDLVVNGRHCYSQNSEVEWLRVWRYRAGMYWASHEPPRLMRKTPSGEVRNVGATHPFLHYETERHGLVFQHFAYVLPQQLEFKETYYGYRNALKEWQDLQQSTERPLALKSHLSWITDHTTADSARTLSITPIANLDGGKCQFLSQAQIEPVHPPKWEARPRVIIDGVFFQLAQSGIARVWKSVLQEWANTPFAKNILVLNRGLTAPIIPHLRYRDIHRFNPKEVERDSAILQDICDLEQADLFISTYHTTPISAPTLQLVHDMIPELLESSAEIRPWIEKTFAILNARSIISVSKHTAADLHQLHPHIPLDEIKVIYPGIDHSQFSPPSSGKIADFKRRHQLAVPYFLVVGNRQSYKNTSHFFQAYSLLPEVARPHILCAGGAGELENDLLALVGRACVQRLELTDEELVLAYGGAVALAYPSLYEGFGLPVLEAMSSGCPVITSRVASIPEVGGDAVIYADPRNVSAWVAALQEIQRPEIREALIAQGLQQARLFSWQTTAGQMELEIRQTVDRLRNRTLPEAAPVLREMRRLMFKCYSLGNDQNKKVRERSIKMKIWGKRRLKITLY